MLTVEMFYREIDTATGPVRYRNYTGRFRGMKFTADTFKFLLQTTSRPLTLQAYLSLLELVSTSINETSTDGIEVTDYTSVMIL